MAVSKAQQQAVSRYVRDKYDRVLVTMPKGKKEAIQAQARAQGASLNAFINRAIAQAMGQDGSETE